MLKLFFLTILVFFSLNSMACWKVGGSFAVDGETWKINNKFDHNKDYIFPMGSFILKLMIKPSPNKKSSLFYTVHEKKGTTLVLVSEGEEENIVEGESRDIYAKGRPGQPNSIITIKLTHI